MSCPTRYRRSVHFPPTSGGCQAGRPLNRGASGAEMRPRGRLVCPPPARVLRCAFNNSGSRHDESRPRVSLKLSEVMTEQVQLTRLPNGLTVLTEMMPGLRSATVGVWVRRGSRHEPEEWNGVCHFIEHAVFKGTGHRTALDIAVESDRLGGHFDAYTTHEMTGFALKVVDTSVPAAFDLLADMLARPRF